MHLTGLALTFFLAISARALPVGTEDLTTTSNSTLETRKAHHHTFKIHVHNNCPFVKEVGLYEITSNFQMLQHGKTHNIHSGHKKTIHAPFHATGMRLSGHAEWGVDGQWQPQALFEFGYSEYAGQPGTAYDLSVMEGSDGDIGIGAYPHNKQCPAKTCFPWDCPADQGWTSPGQTSLGSPADTVCYHGKTAFKVVFCP